MALSIFVKNKKLKKRFFLAALAVFLIFSNGYLIGKAYNFYEPEYPKEQKNYDIAVVLGGFSGLNKRNHEIQFNWANDRLFQTLSLYKKGKIKKILIASGNASLLDNKIKEADLVKKFLHDICIPDSDVLIENQSRNTIENAKFSAQLIAQKFPGAKVVVVTSAWHIPRARLIFNKFYKTKPDYLPTNYIGRTNGYSIGDFIPDPGILSSWELLFKEWIGLAVDQFRG
ncbi:YdcF family protein [Pedobacter rhodius]|uniref:YdcF family protein n=1 Tax=Pedobacter rhodius TaxID=3004098 RepID=A0ABT4KSH6_9SPHI|nr:YdcF family protein [Pedobacter sp. SJ11]MCZ4221740.1 YdcF family protein [Pedobacter sp. SJ11]